LLVPFKLLRVAFLLVNYEEYFAEQRFFLNQKYVAAPMDVIIGVVRVNSGTPGGRVGISFLMQLGLYQHRSPFIVTSSVFV
jgi:hypothetical protein